MNDREGKEQKKGTKIGGGKDQIRTEYTNVT
jgi:hypothetical protein